MTRTTVTGSETTEGAGTTRPFSERFASGTPMFAYDAGAIVLLLHVLRDAPANERCTRRPIVDLTERQKEVLDLLGEGVGAREIARRLGIAEPTVRNHIRAILAALGAHSQLEALATARRNGVL